jgi:hypothetical protein
VLQALFLLRNRNLFDFEKLLASKPLRSPLFGIIVSLLATILWSIFSEQKVLNIKNFIITMLIAFATCSLSITIHYLAMRLVFKELLTNLMFNISNNPIVLRKFIAKLFENLMTDEKFLENMDATRNDGVFNIEELTHRIRHTGVKLSIPIYSELLKSFLIEKPSYLYAIWNVNMVKLDNNTAWHSYLELLKDIYPKIKDKKRIFVFNRRKIIGGQTAATEEIQTTAVVEKIREKLEKEYLIKWGFSSIYVCEESTFRTVRGSDSGSELYDDFIMFATGKKQWIIGIDSKNERTRISDDSRISQNMKKIFEDGNLSKFTKIVIGATN